MATDYIVLRESEEQGRIAISKSVFLSIAEITINEIENIVVTAKWPVSVKIEDNQLKLETDVKVKYGANVNATCSLVQNKIYENILFMTGFKPSDITVNVTGFEI